MKQTNNKRFGILIIAATCVPLASNTVAQSTVGVLNPTPPSMGVQDSPANVGNANFISLSTMQSTVATAFNNNNGGVINWDTANGWTANAQNGLSQTVSYGTLQLNLFTVTRNDGGGLNTFGPTTGSGTLPSSGDNYLGFQNSASPITLSFSSGLASWGMLSLDRAASRTMTFSFTLADNTVINYATETQDPSGNNTGADNWFGFQAPANNPLVSISLTDNGFTRWDDMAFVVASPVPEPSAFALVGLGACSFLVWLRRRQS